MSSSRYSYQRSNTNEIASAMRNPNNFESILVCTAVFIVVGLLMMVTGGVICLIYYTEITPPNFDSNYHRYVGSSMPRIVGKCLWWWGLGHNCLAWQMISSMLNNVYLNNNRKSVHYLLSQVHYLLRSEVCFQLVMS